MIHFGPFESGPRRGFKGSLGGRVGSSSETPGKAWNPRGELDELEGSESWTLVTLEAFRWYQVV